MSPRVLVAGIGNIFFGDDGFGVEVVRQLGERPLPDGVRVADFGIRSYDLAYALMDNWDLAILVDAVPRGGEPGTIYTIQPQTNEAEITGETGFDAHTMNPVAVLRLLHALGGSASNVLVVGCEPAKVEADEDGTIGLSEPVRTAVGEAIHVIEELIARAAEVAAA